MLIARIHGRLFICLRNPKCASTTLGHYLRQLAEEHEVVWQPVSRRNIYHCRGDYSHPHYNHCNLQGAIEILEAMKIDPSPAIVVTTVREPVAKLKSVYFHELRDRAFLVHPGCRRDFEALVLENSHVAQFRPEVFRQWGPYKASHLIRVESFDTDLKRLSRQYDWGVTVSREIRLNKREKRAPLPVSASLRERIRELYARDYEDGGYA